MAINSIKSIGEAINGKIQKEVLVSTHNLVKPKQVMTNEDRAEAIEKVKKQIAEQNEEGVKSEIKESKKKESKSKKQNKKEEEDFDDEEL